jgi:hypothetical protein
MPSRFVDVLIINLDDQALIRWTEGDGVAGSTSAVSCNGLTKAVIDGKLKYEFVLSFGNLDSLLGRSRSQHCQ